MKAAEIPASVVGGRFSLKYPGFVNQDQGHALVRRTNYPSNDIPIATPVKPHLGHRKNSGPATQYGWRIFRRSVPPQATPVFAITAKNPAESPCRTASALRWLHGEGLFAGGHGELRATFGPPFDGVSESGT